MMLRRTESPCQWLTESCAARSVGFQIEPSSRDEAETRFGTLPAGRQHEQGGHLAATSAHKCADSMSAQAYQAPLSIIAVKFRFLWTTVKMAFVCSSIEYTHGTSSERSTAEVQEIDTSHDELMGGPRSGGLMRIPGDGRGWIQSALVAPLGGRKLGLGVELKKVLLHTAAWRDSEDHGWTPGIVTRVSAIED